MVCENEIIFLIIFFVLQIQRREVAKCEGVREAQFSPKISPETEKPPPLASICMALQLPVLGQ